MIEVVAVIYRCGRGGIGPKAPGELLRGVFDVLADHPDGIQARDALAEVEKRLGLTEFEAANYPNSDVRRFEKTVRFQTINAVKAGWMVKEAGVWSPTEEGLAARKKFADPEQFPGGGGESLPGVGGSPAEQGAG